MSCHEIWEGSQMFSSWYIMVPARSLHTQGGKMIQATLGRTKFPAYLAPTTSGFGSVRRKQVKK